MTDDMMIKTLTIKTLGVVPAPGTKVSVTKLLSENAFPALMFS